jgi:hypothetical protein
MALTFDPYDGDKDAPLSPLTKTHYSTLSFSYPADLGLDIGSNHYVVFFINESENTNLRSFTSTNGRDIGDTPTINLQPNQFSNTSQKISRVSTAIALYMPPEINTTYGANWESADLGTTANLLQDWNNNSLANAFKDFGSAAMKEIGAIADARSDLAISKTASHTLRAAYNPHAEVLFNGIPFRSFEFSFQMVPRSQDEAKVINNIIKAFAFHSAAEVNETGGRFLLYPSEFDIKFYSNGVENTYINRISTCALVSVSVNYTGSRAWSSMPDGAPMQTNLSLKFMELEIMHKARILQGF